MKKIIAAALLVMLVLTGALAVAERRRILPENKKHFAGLLTALVTAYCGPISFIGLVVPHVARLLLRTNNHRLLLPVTLLVGACTALLCNLLCQLPGDGGLIPLSAVTPLLGAPVILYVVLRNRGNFS